jgi:hypothetical protein
MAIHPLGLLILTSGVIQANGPFRAFKTGARDRKRGAGRVADPFDLLILPSLSSITSASA